jgi:hypothetical protein
MLRFPAAAESKWAGTACSTEGLSRASGGDSGAKFHNKFRNLINMLDERRERLGLAHEMSSGDIR